jgi:putative SOS response-associated peptidase YedK
MDDDYIRQSKRGPFINARAETVFEARAFANAVRYNRCLILADGFYEPKGEDKIGGTRQKREQHHFALPGRRLFALAGIEAAYPAGDIVGDAANFAILTCAPNDQVAPIHKRMPVIVPDTDWSLWLGGSGVDPAVLNTLLQPWSGSAPKGVLNSNQVSPAINKQDAEGPWCIDPYTSPAEASAQAVASNAKQGSLF